MTVRVTCLAAAIALAVLLAGSTPASTTNSPKTKELIAKITSIDLQAKLIQVAFGAGRYQTLPVTGKAAEHLDEVPVGATFKLTVQDSDDPAGQVVVAIKKTKDAPRPAGTRSGRH
jgi:hypothetical protein